MRKREENLKREIEDSVFSQREKVDNIKIIMNLLTKLESYLKRYLKKK